MIARFVAPLVAGILFAELRCSQRNDRGQWFVEVPGRPEVLRSFAVRYSACRRINE